MKHLLALVPLMLALAACSAAGDQGAPGGEGPSTTTSKGNKSDDPNESSGSAGHSNDSLPVGDAPASGADACGDGLDDDGNDKVDDGCPCVPGKTQPCFAGNPKLAGVGPCVKGTQQCIASQNKEFNTGTWGDCKGSGSASQESCNGVDDDCNGVVDDGCECHDGQVQDCTTACGSGTQSCAGGKWSDCDGPQPNQNGNCAVVITQNLSVNGDCVCAPPCPAETPYVIGCNILMDGGNANGCVALAGPGRLYFQEGVHCFDGYVSGTVTCSSEPGEPLSAANCPINKPNPIYAQQPSGCPEIATGQPDWSCYF
ncbi:MAG: hypothetical protein HY898_21760 [Deltaproteobacteria bacterium]|nr:hypothetical protein [Deltaproteobacteria bacterium]